MLRGNKVNNRFDSPGSTMVQYAIVEFYFADSNLPFDKYVEVGILWDIYPNLYLTKGLCGHFTPPIRNIGFQSKPFLRSNACEIISRKETTLFCVRFVEVLSSRLMRREKTFGVARRLPRQRANLREAYMLSVPSISILQYTTSTKGGSFLERIWEWRARYAKKVGRVLRKIW